MACILAEWHADSATVCEGGLQLLAGRLTVHVYLEARTLRVLRAHPAEDFFAHAGHLVGVLDELRAPRPTFLPSVTFTGAPPRRLNRHRLPVGTARAPPPSFWRPTTTSS